MNMQDGSISVLEPIPRALARVKTVLFRPFDPGRWLVIGFCAWLAGLGQGGGGGGGGGGPHFQGGGRQQIAEGLQEAWEYVLGNLHWILPLVIGLVVLGLLLWLLLTWLSSRGQFLFLHCVATNRAEVRVPWTLYRAHANSLFLFRLVLGLASFLLLAPAILGGLALILSMVLEERLSIPRLAGAGAAFAAAVVFGVIFAVIEKFTRDFVIPWMTLRTSRCRTAWREFLGLLWAHKAAFFVYLLMQIVLAIVVGVLVLAGMILTCCCACCLLMIPLVGTLLLLPILVFDRAYSLYYLAQFGPAFQVISDESPPPATATARA